MKEKIKNMKGITLVALIITIIVLLILAVVAITSISNSNIIKHAQNGSGAYKQGEKNETKTINEYEKYLEDNNPLNSSSEVEWTCYTDPQNGYKILMYIGRNNKVTLKSTDTLLAYDGTWDENADEDILIPGTNKEKVDLSTLKNDADSEISLDNNNTIKDLSLDKDFASSVINIKIPRNILVLRYLEGAEVLSELDSFQSLETLYLPSSINRISSQCFYDCGTNTANGKTTIIYNGTKAKWNEITIESTQMSGITVKCTDGDLTI